MTKKFLSLLLYLVFFLSSISIVLILLYIDPYLSNDIVIASLVISSVLCVSSILTALLYFVKKIHYRGEVLVTHLSSSMRQSLFVALFLCGLGVFIRMEIPFYISSLLLFILIVFLELFIQSVLS